MLFRHSALLVLTTLLATSFMVLVSSQMSDAECNAYVEEVNRNASIAAFQDLQCLNKTMDAGCFANTCRFCRLETTEQSKFFVHCNESTEAGKEAALYCPALVPSGDQDAGISAFYDPACPGLGCQSNNCRFCKIRNTTQSAVYVNCPTASISTEQVCLNAVTNSKLTSVSFVNQTSCNVPEPRLVGCVASTTCRLCRKENEKNEGNQYLVSCKVLRETQTIELMMADSSQELMSASNVDEAVVVEEDYEILSASTLGDSDKSHSDASAASEDDHEIVDVLDALRANLMDTKEEEDDDDHSEVYAWTAGFGSIVLAVVVAGLAIRKSHRRRLDAMKTPRTPMDIESFMSVKTCIATL